jgi:hypothetical protein
VVSETVKADATHIHDDVVDKVWCPDIYQYAQLFGPISKSIKLLDSIAYDMASGLQCVNHLTASICSDPKLYMLGKGINVHHYKQIESYEQGKVAT